MRIRKSQTVTLGAVLFGGLGVPFGCLVSPTMGTSIVPQPGLAFLITVVGFALFGSAVGFLLSLSGDPPDPPTDAEEGNVP